ncbi:MAG: DUF2357 domain-containing protein [Candidatus Bathyarchaeia archaeon]
MIDLDSFPKELRLFGAESAWLIKDKMAIVRDADESDIDKAEIILSLKSYRRLDISEEVLEHYYTSGDESIIKEVIVEAPEVAPKLAEIRETKPVEMEVVIPEAVTPIVGLGSEIPETGKDEVIIPPSLGRFVRTRPTPQVITPPEERVPPTGELVKPELELGAFEVEKGIMIDEIKDFSIYLVHSRLSVDIGQRLVDWFNYIKSHWRVVEPIIEMIALAPHHSLSKRHVKKPIQEVDGLDLEVINSLITELEGLGVVKTEGTTSVREALLGLPIRVLVEEKYPDYDVYENRLMKYHIESLAEKYGELLEAASERDRYLRKSLKLSKGAETVNAAKEFLTNNEMMVEVEKIKKRIDNLLSDPKMDFLEKVSSPDVSQIVSETLRSHPHYSKFYDHLLAYERSAPPPIIRLKSTGYYMLKPSELYVRWCTIKILEILMDLGYQVENENIVQLEEGGVIVSVDDSIEVSLAGKDNEVKLLKGRIYTNEPPYGSYSTPKKATIAIEVFKRDEVPTIAIFEPRYDPDYTEDRFREIDIDGLHVLHDSIVDLRTDRHEKLVRGGFVLHPTRMGHIRYGNLAAISLRPSRTSRVLKETLEDLLDPAAKSSSDRS